MKTTICILIFCLFQSLHLKAQTSQEDKEKFMKLAIEQTVLPGNEISSPFGAVIVKDGVVIGKGFNNSELTHDATAHGEIVAIRDACKNLSSKWLEGCEIYTTGEPCPMCFAAIYWAGIKTIYYAATKEDLDSFGIGIDIYREACLPYSERSIKFEIVLRDEADKVFERYNQQEKK